jgi:hypothetical protein
MRINPRGDRFQANDLSVRELKVGDDKMESEDFALLPGFFSKWSSLYFTFKN